MNDSCAGFAPAVCKPERAAPAANKTALYRRGCLVLNNEHVKACFVRRSRNRQAQDQPPGLKVDIIIKITRRAGVTLRTSSGRKRLRVSIAIASALRTTGAALNWNGPDVPSAASSSRTKSWVGFYAKPAEPETLSPHKPSASPSGGAHIFRAQHPSNLNHSRRKSSERRLFPLSNMPEIGFGLQTAGWSGRRKYGTLNPDRHRQIVRRQCRLDYCRCRRLPLPASRLFTAPFAKTADPAVSQQVARIRARIAFIGQTALGKTDNNPLAQLRLQNSHDLFFTLTIKQYGYFRRAGLQGRLKLDQRNSVRADCCRRQRRQRRS